MAISLSKGGNVNLSKEAPGMKKIVVGLGWDARVTDGAAFDLDASAFLVKLDGKVRSDNDFCFYNNKSVADGAVQHAGDNLTGAGDGDDEQIKVDLDKVDGKVKHIVFTVNSFRGQKFTVVENAFVRIVNQADNKELCRFNLSEKFPTTGLVMARLYRHGGEWKFAAMGEGVDGQTIKDMVGKIQALLG